MIRILCSLLAFAVVLCAQESADFRALSKNRALTPTDLVKDFEAPPMDAYRLEPGDEITVDIWSHPELSSHQIIGPDGRITVPVYGPLKVSKLTREESQGAISGAMARYYPNLVTTVRVDHYNGFQIFVLGRVGTPGALTFTKQPTLLDVLSRAGGLPVGGTGAEKAGLVRCAVFRGRDKIIWIDLKSLLSQGNLALNIRLASEDVVYLPDADDQLVYVLGFVKNPGAFRLTPAMSFLDALSLAGGPTDDAATSRLSLIRSGKGMQRRVPLKELLSGKAEYNFSLEEGDIVYAPPRGLEKFGYAVQKIAPLTGFAIIYSAFK